MLKGFKEFISRGNVVELAVGVIIGAAFKNIVDALVDGIINPLIAAVIGKPDFSDAFILTLNGTDVKFGVLITAVINFLLMAFAIYFCIVVPMNALNARRKKDADETPKEVSEEVQLLTEIRDASPRATAPDSLALFARECGADACIGPAFLYPPTCPRNWAIEHDSTCFCTRAACPAREPPIPHAGGVAQARNSRPTCG